MAELIASFESFERVGTFQVCILFSYRVNSVANDAACFQHCTQEVDVNMTKDKFVGPTLVMNGEQGKRSGELIFHT